MNRMTFCKHGCLAVTLVLFAFGIQLAHANDAAISGSYQIVEKTDLGAQVKVVVRLHLTNHGQNPLSLKGVLLSDFAYPHTGGPRMSPVTLRAGSSQDVSQEFVIPRAEYEQWQKGLHPRVVLELQTTTGGKITQAVRLERTPAGKGK